MAGNGKEPESEGAPSPQRTEGVDQQRLFFQEVLASAPVAMVVFDGVTLRVRWANAAFLDLTDQPCGSQELVGTHLTELVPDAEERGLLATCKQVVASGKPYHQNEYAFPRSEGGLTYWDWSLLPFSQGAKGRRDLLVMALDVTERRQMELEQERLLGELDATFNALTDAVVTYRPNGEIMRLNAAARALFTENDAERDLPAGKLQPSLPIFSPEGKALDLEEMPFWRALEGETMRGMTAYLQRADGQYQWLSISAGPIKGQEGSIDGAVVTLADITPMHEMQSQRDAYMHTISHDLRSPLTVIQGHSQLLELALKKSNNWEDLRLHLESILQGCARMDALIEDLVDMARFEGGKLVLVEEPVQLLPFIADLLRRSQMVIEQDRVRADIPEDLPLIAADPGRLERILINLLSNAAKYSAPQAPVEIIAVEEGKMVRIKIRDLGPGIATEDLPHIFDRFYRGQATGNSGVGLGLYITRMLVEAHGGEIQAKSRPGEGSTFSFTVPFWENKTPDHPWH